ncbi:hypothetical protein PIB30_055803 [Stylosanthes scabra]|uniref:Uncharacterized protein n=1 Tax=Stylosanthes scabra TaxID=79078 RepID=A0ABU6TJ14_9FABA|nr:hypothetical protein [Stylosanthes scabra]
MAAFKFLVSLPSDLLKKSKFTCRFILDGSDAEVGKLLDDLLDVNMKRTKLDDLMAKMADPARMGPCPVLPTGRLSATAAAAAAAFATAGTSTPAAVGSSREGTSIQVPPAPDASEAKKAKKQLKKREQTMVVDLEDELKEDPAADLQRQRWRKKPKFDEAFEKALGDDAAWEHKVDPLRVAFPEDFDYRKALNAGLTSAPVREALTKMPPEQLLGESYHLHAKSLASVLGDRAEASGGRRGSSGGSGCFIEDLPGGSEVSKYWRSEWRTLGSEVTEMCQETLDICLDQVSHLCPGVDFSAITLKSRWDPKGRRIFVPQESEVEGELPSAEEIVPERDPVAAAQSSQPEAGDVAGGSGECPT